MQNLHFLLTKFEQLIRLELCVLQSSKLARTLGAEICWGNPLCFQEYVNPPIIAVEEVKYRTRNKYIQQKETYKDINQSKRKKP